MSDRRTEFTQSGFPQSETQPLAFGVNSADPNPVNSGSNLLGNALGSFFCPNRQPVRREQTMSERT
jgi:hypothetical protein